MLTQTVARRRGDGRAAARRRSDGSHGLRWAPMAGGGLLQLGEKEGSEGGPTINSEENLLNGGLPRRGGDGTPVQFRAEKWPPVPRVGKTGLGARKKGGGVVLVWPERSGKGKMSVGLRCPFIAMAGLRGAPARQEKEREGAAGHSPWGSRCASG
jgi:hypothetical protein